jgi:hypothetical protein
MPEMLEYSADKNFILKEYIEGDVGSLYVSKNKPAEKILRQLFELSNHLRENNFNIDYFPSNFVIAQNKLYYIDYEINKYDPKWSFENWGIYYWLNREGFEKFIETGDSSYINADIFNGIPVRKPFESRAKGLISKYSNYSEP